MLKEMFFDENCSLRTSMAIINSSKDFVHSSLNLAVILHILIGLNRSTRKVTTRMLLIVLEPHQRVWSHINLIVRTITIIFFGKQAMKFLIQAIVTVYWIEKTKWTKQEKERKCRLQIVSKKKATWGFGWLHKCSSVFERKREQRKRNERSKKKLVKRLCYNYNSKVEELWRRIREEHILLYFYSMVWCHFIG